MITVQIWTELYKDIMSKGYTRNRYSMKYYKQKYMHKYPSNAISLLMFIVLTPVITC